MPRRVPAVRRRRPQHHRERAPRRDQLSLRRQPADPRRPGPADAERSAPEPRHPHHGQARPGPRGRGIRDGRRHFARPARDRIRQVGRLRDGVGQREPRGHPRALREAIDLIVKTLTHRDGPFSWEGKYFTHRHVNIWPRPWQQPHPPLWAATGDVETAEELGRRGIINAIFLRGVEGTKRAWTAYRQAREAASLPAPGPDRFAYMGFTYVGDTDEEGMRVGEKSLWFLNVGARSAPQYTKFLPGQFPPQLAPAIYRTTPGPAPIGVAHTGRPEPGSARLASRAPRAPIRNVTAEQAIAQGLMFAGNPDTVFRQIMDFRAKAGEFEHLILMGRSGFMTHDEAERGIERFAKEVLPRLREAS